MNTFAMLTHEPENLLRAYGASNGWSVTPFTSAVDALEWERRLRREGAIVLGSRGWRFGVVFTLDTVGDGSAPTATAASDQRAR